jgi:hypothetical protein
MDGPATAALEQGGGDGLVAFGATIIPPVQAHWRTDKPVAGQWLLAEKANPRAKVLTAKKSLGTRRRASNGRTAAPGHPGQHLGHIKERAA